MIVIQNEVATCDGKTVSELYAQELRRAGVSLIMMNVDMSQPEDTYLQYLVGPYGDRIVDATNGQLNSEVFRENWLEDVKDKL